MYHWKIVELKKELIRSGLTEAESFKYLMANSILLTVACIEYAHETHCQGCKRHS